MMMHIQYQIRNGLNAMAVEGHRPAAGQAPQRLDCIPSVRKRRHVRDCTETNGRESFHRPRHMAMGTNPINTRSQPERDGAPTYLPNHIKFLSGKAGAGTPAVRVCCDKPPLGSIRTTYGSNRLLSACGGIIAGRKQHSSYPAGRGSRSTPRGCPMLAGRRQRLLWTLRSNVTTLKLLSSAVLWQKKAGAQGEGEANHHSRLFSVMACSGSFSGWPARRVEALFQDR
jgi:hypothetical protein